MNPIVEGRPYPVFIEEEDVLLGVRYIGLRIGNPKPEETQKTPHDADPNQAACLFAVARS
jgi:hypothetical protein